MENYQILYFIFILFIGGLLMSLLSRETAPNLVIKHKWIDFNDKLKDLIESSIGNTVVFPDNSKYVLIGRLENIDDLIRLSFKLRESYINESNILNIHVVVSKYGETELTTIAERFFTIDNFKAEWSEFLISLKD